MLMQLYAPLGRLELGRVNLLRRAARRGLLEERECKVVEQLGVRIADGSRWFEGLCADLARYQAVHGAGALPLRSSAVGKRVHRARKLHARGRLHADRVARLDVFGVPWALGEVLGADEVTFARAVREVELHVVRTGLAQVSYDQVGLGLCARELFDIAFALAFAQQRRLLPRDRAARVARLGVRVIRAAADGFVVVDTVRSLRAAA